ncbi:MAG: glycosyltransferase [Candidatus Omnitrophica bacterium]|nr:glycosyltransferase [Candidatus Omnitrophota bacterium]
MKYYCTYFDSHYLTKGIALYRSLCRFAGDFRLWVLCFDDMTFETLQKINLPEVVPIRLLEFEAFNPGLADVKSNRTTVEYYFTCTPFLPLFILNAAPEVDLITYLDADLLFLSSPDPIYTELGDGSILIIGHRFPPHLEHLEARGIYNVSLLAFRRDGSAVKCLKKWGEQCLEWCYDREENGLYADQKYLDDWPRLFKGVVVLEHKGVGLAPWNVERYKIRYEERGIFIDSLPLVLFHFHGLRKITKNIYDPRLHRYEVDASIALRHYLYMPYIKGLIEIESWLRDLFGTGKLPFHTASIRTVKGGKPEKWHSRIGQFKSQLRFVFRKAYNNDYWIFFGDRLYLFFPKFDKLLSGIKDKKLYDMTLQKLKVMQVHTVEEGGGAAKVAWNLFNYLEKRGCMPLMGVGYKRSKKNRVYRILGKGLNEYWVRAWLLVGRSIRKYMGRIAVWPLRISCSLAGLFGKKERYYGFEDLDFPVCRKLLDIPRERPDLVHCHCLHGGYFDLGAIPYLSSEVPLMFTLHDAWLLTGHCAHFMECMRWKTGCGECPDLLIYPSVWRDITARDWAVRKDIFSRSRLYVATPSKWLMENVKRSMMMPAIAELRVINNGVDLSVFRPGDKSVARKRLGLPLDARIILFIGNGIRKNVFKDYETIRTSAIKASRSFAPSGKILFLVLGETGPVEIQDNLEIKFMSFENDTRKVADMYRAADIYAHAARADTFPNTVLEALACGIPVVASAVGGIPEQVKGLKAEGAPPDEWNSYGPEEATGILVPRGDSAKMSEAIAKLLKERDLNTMLGQNAAKDACQRFDLNNQCSKYHKWYEEILADWGRKK